MNRSVETSLREINVSAHYGAHSGSSIARVGPKDPYHAPIGVDSPSINLTTVDFPAAFGPSSATISPR